jgi:hypothetical protein
MILQIDNGREYTTNIITELKSLWHDLKIVHGRPLTPRLKLTLQCPRRIILLTQTLNPP